MDSTTKPQAQLEKLAGLHARLAARILGQGHVLPTLAAAIIRSELGLVPKAPRLLLLGPTGVGKTETALVVAQLVFDCEPVRIDMSELQRPDALEVLLGNRSGDPGLLATLLGGKDHGVLLFDEIEKAHPRVLDLFLQILEPGHVTLACGRRRDLRRFILIATSNIAAAELVEVQSSSRETIERHVLSQTRQTLRAEILNRFDAAVVFLPLEYDSQLAIVKQHLAQHLAWLGNQGWHVTAGPRVETFLLSQGFDRNNGARPLRRAVQNFVGDAVANDRFAGGDGCGRLEVDSTQRSLLLRKPKDFPAADDAAIP